MKPQKMKRLIYFTLAISWLVTSCTQDFASINTNPNASEKVEPQFLLTNILVETADANTYEQGFRLSNFICQFSADIEFERIDRYEMGSNAGYWNLLYGLLSDIRSMQEAPAANEAYIAVGDILKSYIFSQLTDMWGDVPYRDAVKAKDGITAPAYDRQEDIYTATDGILATLKNAAEVLSQSKETIAGDVLFHGNLDQWVKFANSLRVRYIMRISRRLTDFSELQALADSGPLMESNADNAVIPYLATAPNQFPLSQSALGIYNGHRMSSTIGNTLLEWNDPRIAILFKPTTKSIAEGNPRYKGLRNGQTRETIAAEGIDLNDISLFGAIWRDVPDGVDAQYMQFAELQFALAEAVERGYISGDAKAYYENGIKAHFAYLGAVLPADYLSQDNIALNGENHLGKILTQKWVSLISNGHEAWFNVRRTGIPKLIPGPDNMNDDRFPVRYLYPEGEQATNTEHYQEAVRAMGGDNINAKGWWEK